MTKAIVTTHELCLACGTCVIECAMAHTNAETLVEAIYCETPAQSRIHLEPIGEFGMPMQCRHCEEAPCIVVCPTDAIHRFSDDGPVVLVQEQCIGCRLCLLVCPFGVIEMSRAGTALVKCDLCVERTEAGQDPACVAGCPTGALQFNDISDYLRQRRREAASREASSSQISVSMSEGNDGPYES